MNAAGRPADPERRDDDNDDTTEEPAAMNTPFATPADHTTAHTWAAGATGPDQPLEAPLPYGAGFTPTQQFGYGVAPEPVRYTPAPVATRERERSGSPVLAAAGLLSMGVAVWAILGAPMVTTTMMLAAALVVAVLVGLVMVVRR